MKNNDTKIDKDLQLDGEIKYQVTWMEQPNGDMKMYVRYNLSKESQLVMMQALASYFDNIIADDKEKVKGKKMKLSDRNRLKDTRDLLASSASEIGKEVYEKQISEPDNRIQLLNANGELPN